jgi:hypothetical protein
MTYNDTTAISASFLNSEDRCREYHETYNKTYIFSTEVSSENCNTMTLNRNAEWFGRPIECIDSDEGVDIYTKGIVEAMGRTFFDRCDIYEDKDIVVEVVCESTGANTIELYCPGECKDGACLKVEGQNSEETVGEVYRQETGDVVEKIVEEIKEPFLLEDCWDRNKNGIEDTIEDINFDKEIDVFDCLVVYDDREEIKNKINDYIGEMSRTTSFLIGSADIEILVEDKENEALLYDVKFSDGKVVDFSKGSQQENSNYIIQVDNSLAKEILLSGNPKTKIINAYWGGEIVIIPQTFGAKVKYFIVDKLNLAGQVISNLI